MLSMICSVIDWLNENIIAILMFRGKTNKVFLVVKPFDFLSAELSILSCLDFSLFQRLFLYIVMNAANEPQINLEFQGLSVTLSVNQILNNFSF
jgi:hypothetical protein